MKKSVLFAFVVLAVSAQAQYNVDPSTQTVINKGSIATVDAIILNQEATAWFQSAGAEVNQIGADEQTRHFYWWNQQAWANGPVNALGVDGSTEGYVSIDITGQGGWSGGGFAVAAPGINIAHFTEDTRFHLAYRTAKMAPASVGIVLIDAVLPAKVAIGGPYNDESGVFSPVGETPADEWKAIDISLADLKRFYPSFDWTVAKAGTTLEAWQGNILSILPGTTPGTNICFDATYFYTMGNSGVAELEVNTPAIVVTNRTINASGADSIELYSLTGRLVRSVAGTVMGIEDLGTGVYVAKAGNSVAKVVVR